MLLLSLLRLILAQKPWPCNYGVSMLLQMDESVLPDTSAPFQIPVRVYYEDTDAGGIVYYVNYLKFMERARTEYLRSLGYEQQRMMDDQRIFVVSSASVKYKSPARLDDLLHVTAERVSVGKVKIEFKQQIFCKEKLLCEGLFVIGCVDSISLKPAIISENLRKKCY